MPQPQPSRKLSRSLPTHSWPGQGPLKGDGPQVVSENRGLTPTPSQSGTGSAVSLALDSQGKGGLPGDGRPPGDVLRGGRDVITP